MRFRAPRSPAPLATVVVAAAAAMLWPTTGRAQVISETSIQVGELIDGVLTDDDGVDPSTGHYADHYLFEATAGERLDILLTSASIDCYLLVRDPSGSVIAEDDDSGGDYDSRVVLTLPLDGLYTVVATSYGLETGPYQVLVREDHPQPIVFERLVPGRPTHGALTETDGRRTDSRYVDGYRFQAEAGTRIHLTLTSATFDTYLMLLSPLGEVMLVNDDQQAGGTDSELAVDLPYTGEYRVIATSYQPATGDYVVELETVEQRPIRDREIAIGRPVEGELEADDGTWRPRGTYADGYRFEGRGSQRLVIDMTSTLIDTFLVLLGPDGLVVASNDDSGGGTDSRIAIALPRDGDYRLIATSYRTATGPYLLTVVAQPPAVVERRPLAVGEGLSGELDETDPTSQRDATPMELYDLPLEVGQRVHIRMSSADLDPYLWVVGPNGEVLAEDDDTGGGTDALIDLLAPYTGLYLVVATTRAGLGGRYQISATDALEALAAQTAPIGLDDHIEGMLEPGDGRRPANDAYQDVYQLDVTAGLPLEIRLTSTELDPYLILMGPSGDVVAEDDDGGGGLNSRIQVIPDTSGSYRIVATSYAPASGSYELSTRRYDPAAIEIRPLRIGSTVSGQLTGRDPLSPRYGTLVDGYELAGEQGRRIRLTMSSGNLDPYLVLIDPNGEVVAEDDDSGGGFNAAIEMALPMSGTYRVLATSLRYAEGDYQLDAERVEAPSGEGLLWRGEGE